MSEVNKIIIKTQFIKLNQILKLSGFCMSGGEANQLIIDGKVKVNGVVEIRKGRKIIENDIVEVFNNILEVTR